MASIVRFSALAAFVSAVSGYAIGEFPSQTVGYGSPFKSEPTEAPSMELVKKSLGKRALINTCTEWTIQGGLQPECSNSETCLFTQATDGYFYEGCGQTSIAYNWVTECWPYPQIGTAPVSQIYCPADAPACGFLAFQFDEFNTYYNFGCSIESYSLYVDLISTTDVLAGGGTTSITVTAPVTATITVGGTETSTSEPVVIPGGFGQGTASSEATATEAGTSSSTNLPTINSHKKKKAPIGGIVGGVVGGIAVIAIVAFFILFFLRKRRQDAASTKTQEAQAQQQQADAATTTALHNNNRISEIGGTMKPVPEGQGAFAPVYANGSEKLMGQQVSEYPSPTPQSPPPMYAQPVQQSQSPPPAQQVYAQPPPQSQSTPQQIYAQPVQQSQSPPPGQQMYAQVPQIQSLPQAQQAPTSPYPPSNYTELESQILHPGSGHTSVQPVSPVGTYNPNATELGGSSVVTYQQSPSPQNVQQPYQPPPNATELGGGSVVTYQQSPSPQNVQQPYQPPPNAQVYQAPPNVPEMSGNAATVRPVRQSGGFDMSGAPMSEDYGHHELP